MEILSLNHFSLLTLLAGGMLLVRGVMYKLNPPKNMTWYGGMQLKIAQRNKDVFQEAIRFAAMPMIVAGLMLLVVGLLPIFFVKFYFFTFALAITLIIITCIVINSLIIQHINSLFDKEGNRRELIT